MKENSNETSPSGKVSERLIWLAGKNVMVRLRSADPSQTEEFAAIYLDCYPMGRAYFFVLAVAGKRRVIQTDHVLELTEL